MSDDVAVDALASTMAVVLGLIDQGAADRDKLLAFLESLVDDLPEAERQQGYGFLLQKWITALATIRPGSKDDFRKWLQ